MPDAPRPASQSKDLLSVNRIHRLVQGFPLRAVPRIPCGVRALYRGKRSFDSVDTSLREPSTALRMTIRRGHKVSKAILGLVLRCGFLWAQEREQDHIADGV